MPRISVIVPVYNVEKYLHRCINSILSQSFKDFELILVDDGSTDNSGIICDEYKKKDNRIVVFHQSNQGQGKARNVALDWIFNSSDSEWISFIDSDDYIHPQMFEFLMSFRNLKNADILLFGYVEGTEDCFDWNVLNTNISIECGNDFLRKCIVNNINRCWILCDKLFRRDCLKNIRLPEGRIHEDNATVYKLLYQANTVVINDSVLYYYYTNPDSTMNKEFSLKRLDWLIVMEEMLDYFKDKKEPEIFDWVNRFYLESLLNSYNRMRKHFPESPEIKRIKDKIIRQYKSEKQRIKISITTHPYLFNTIWPVRSKIYWKYRGVRNKLKKKS